MVQQFDEVHYLHQDVERAHYGLALLKALQLRHDGLARIRQCQRLQPSQILPGELGKDLMHVGRGDLFVLCDVHHVFDIGQMGKDQNHLVEVLDLTRLEDRPLLLCLRRR